MSTHDPLEKPKKASHHVRKELNWLKKTQAEKPNQELLLNIFKLSKNVELRQEPNFSSNLSTRTSNASSTSLNATPPAVIQSKPVSSSSSPTVSVEPVLPPNSRVFERPTSNTTVRTINSTNSLISNSKNSSSKGNSISSINESKPKPFVNLTRPPAKNVVDFFSQNKSVPQTPRFNANGNIELPLSRGTPKASNNISNNLSMRGKTKEFNNISAQVLLPNMQQPKLLEQLQSRTSSAERSKLFNDRISNFVYDGETSTSLSEHYDKNTENGKGVTSFADRNIEANNVVTIMTPLEKQALDKSNSLLNSISGFIDLTEDVPTKKRKISETPIATPTGATNNTEQSTLEKVAIKDKLIAALTEQNELLLKKCSILQSTSLSEDHKRKQIKYNVDPLIETQSLEISTLQKQVVSSDIQKENFIDSTVQSPPLQIPTTSKSVYSYPEELHAATSNTNFNNHIEDSFAESESDLEELVNQCKSAQYMPPNSTATFDSISQGPLSSAPFDHQQPLLQSSAAVSKKSNLSDITDEAEYEDSNYFNSGIEEDTRSSDRGFIDDNGNTNISMDEDASYKEEEEEEEVNLDRIQDNNDENHSSLVEIIDSSPLKRIVDYQHQSDTEMSLSENDFELLMQKNNHTENGSDEEDPSDIDDLMELENDVFDIEREHFTQNIKDVDDDLKIISETKLTEEQLDHAAEVAIKREAEARQKPPQTSNSDLGLEEEDDDEDILNMAQPSYPWTDEVNTQLHQVFKLSSFRANQLDAINGILGGRDVFVLMPTGGGKSLCYQLPAVVKRGQLHLTTIVISPLISLMQDQVEHLRKKNIRAGMISSKNTTEDRRHMFNLFIDGLLDLVYLSPEMVSASQQCKRAIDKLHREQKLARIVVDEAHCVSNWGHDFRPDYKELKWFKEMYPTVPIMALTATASEQVRMDIVHNLKLKDPLLLKQSFNRSNLIYKVAMKNKNTIFEMAKEIKTKFKNMTGIIYCNSKNQCEKTSQFLSTQGVSCSYYHAGMENDDRSRVQRQWQNDELKVVCATVAFGMGIDKPNVRFVYHFTLPRSLEGYYQECGRGGRDGKTSYCTLYFNYADFKSIESLVKRDKDLSKDNREKHLSKLNDVLQYCNNTIECRRKLVLSYFNEAFDPKTCRKTCDNCRANNLVTQKDITKEAKDIIALVGALDGQQVTASYCMDVFRGSKSSKIVTAGHDNLPQHGLGKAYRKDDLQRIFQNLISAKYIGEYTKFNKSGFASTYMKRGTRALKDKVLMNFALNKPSSSGSKSSTRLSSAAAPLDKEEQKAMQQTYKKIASQSQANSYGNKRKKGYRGAKSSKKYYKKRSRTG